MIKTCKTVSRAITAVAVVAAACAAGTAQAAIGDTQTYNFNAEATGGAVPTITQATLLLTETALGVNFLLTPAWAVTTGNRVDALTFAYSGEALTFVQGAEPIPTFSTGSGAVDSGYSTTSLVTLNFDPSGAGKFDSSYASSAWSLNGSTITLADFQIFATATSTKPTPAFGVISMPGAVPSNWVALGVVTQVPEPASLALFMSGIAVLAGLARRRLR